MTCLVWKQYLIRASSYTPAAHTLLKTARASTDQPVSLEGVVILHVLCELRERIACGRALCST